MLLTQTLLIAGDDALRLTLDPGFTGKANVQCLFDHATVAARGCVLHLPEVKQTEPPAEPIILQTHDCAFLNLFIGRKDRAGLVRYEDDALARGLLVWQSDNDAFDRRLWYAAAPAAGPLPDKVEDHASWVALWGTPGLRHAQLNRRVFTILDTEALAARSPRQPENTGSRLGKTPLVPATHEKDATLTPTDRSELQRKANAVYVSQNVNGIGFALEFARAQSRLLVNMTIRKMYQNSVATAANKARAAATC